MSGKENTGPNFLDQPLVDRYEDDGTLVLDLKGAWCIHTIHLVDSKMQRLEMSENRKAVIHVDDITRLDTSGAWLIERLGYALHSRGVKISVKGAKTGWLSLIETIGKAHEKVNDREEDVHRLPWLARIPDFVGRLVINSADDFRSAMFILGAAVRGAQLKSGKHGGLSLPAVVTQIDKMGIGAVPIITLMSFIVGAIIAQQGIIQLQNFGAAEYTAAMVGILVFRELGVLLTAIMIAGRSGSAITAEIGSMKMREETDALQVMGLNPVGVLVFPRLVALAVILPLLTIVADIAAILGGALVTKLYATITMDMFWTQLKDSVWLSTYFAGLIKAPFMALVIGIIASVEGLKVGGSAESLGQRVTSSVVKSIFIVIVMDGFFAMFYAAIDF